MDELKGGPAPDGPGGDVRHGQNPAPFRAGQTGARISSGIMSDHDKDKTHFSQAAFLKRAGGHAAEPAFFLAREWLTSKS